MPYRYLSLLALCALLAGCAPALSVAERDALQQKRAYVEQLRQKNPAELTEEEIAYLTYVEERQQATDVNRIANVATTSLVIGAVGVIVAVGVAVASNTD